MRLPDRTGFRGKTLWDWLQLLIVPAILVGATFTWSASQTRSDNKREDRRIAADRAAAEEARQAATLQGYLDQMSGLMLREKLLTSREGSAVQAVARTVTLAALRRLDGERKGAAVAFLSEARLLGRVKGSLQDGQIRQDALVRLPGADLKGADFREALLSEVDFGEVDLTGTNLVDAQLFDARLVGANLSGAQLAGAQLMGADLSGANLTDASLVGAGLTEAFLTSADLRRADLRRADLAGAELSDADVVGADLRGANLVGASLVGGGPLGGSVGFVKGLDLGRYLSDLTPKQQKAFLDSQEALLDSLSSEELSKFKLTPEKLATFRRDSRRS